MSEIPSIDEFIDQQLASGRYASRDELTREAFRVMQAHELAIAEVAEELRGAVERMKRGEPAEEVDPETFIAEATARHNAKKNGA